jgi:hypothetical protein
MTTNGGLKEMQRLDKFWVQWKELGQEILAHGQDVQFGHSLLEIKYMNGVPSVLVLSKSMKRKFPSDQIAKLSIAQEMEATENSTFTGARTWTITYDKGHISHILIDEYGNKLI